MRRDLRELLGEWKVAGSGIGEENIRGNCKQVPALNRGSIKRASVGENDHSEIRLERRMEARPHWAQLAALDNLVFILRTTGIS